ncbi:MAG: 7-carboxy-7-deazaguanine synthase QueE [Candidatus Omnitrophota bacterium]
MKITGRVSEVFESVQGEGLYLGEKQIFVRFFGCNLNCQFCDTKLSGFFEYEPQELFEEIVLYNHDFHSVSFTGGEPLLQHDFLKEVLMLTKKNGYKNYLETNGTLPGELEDIIDYLDIVAMDIKLPTSSGMGNLWGMHRKFLKIASKKDVFLKAIVCESTKEEDLKIGLNLIKEINSSAVLVLQPNSFDSQEKLAQKLENFKNICADEKVTACVIAQMHKIAGVR